MMIGRSAAAIILFCFFCGSYFITVHFAKEGEVEIPALISTVIPVYTTALTLWFFN